MRANSSSRLDIPQTSKIVNSNHPKVSVIIPVMNEIRTLAAVILRARNVHPQTEVIVVANGCTDGSQEMAQSMGARVIAFRIALGHDVGRSVGAMAAKGDILLFTDADIVIPTRDLQKQVNAVESGIDIALNKYSSQSKMKRVHSAVLSKYALNTLLNRSDLKGSSLTAIPHALSRTAVEKIGADSLSVPPLAQAIAILEGLRVHAVHSINVGRNPRKRRQYRKDPVTNLIIGDHLEAIECLIERTGPRGNFTDLSGQERMEMAKHAES